MRGGGVDGSHDYNEITFTKVPNHGFGREKNNELHAGWKRKKNNMDVDITRANQDPSHNNYNKGFLFVNMSLQL